MPDARRRRRRLHVRRAGGGRRRSSASSPRSACTRSTECDMRSRRRRAHRRADGPQRRNLLSQSPWRCTPTRRPRAGRTAVVGVGAAPSDHAGLVYNVISIGPCATQVLSDGFEPPAVNAAPARGLLRLEYPAAFGAWSVTSGSIRVVSTASWHLPVGGSQSVELSDGKLRRDPAHGQRARARQHVHVAVRVRR